MLIFCNHSPIVFHSKKQGSIEASSFGSEFMAMKTGIELVEGLRFKLRMMGCPLDGATCVIAENMSVVHNCTRPNLVLKKKSCSIVFHFCRERIAAKVVFVVWTKSEGNLVDMFTKSQPGPSRNSTSTTGFVLVLDSRPEELMLEALHVAEPQH